MDNNRLATASLDDMVFEGRNKAYGAYMLRRLYGKHVTAAVIIAIILFVLFLSAPLIKDALFPEEEVEVEIPKVTVVDLAAPPSVDKAVPPPPPPPNAPPPPPPVRSTVKFTPPVVKKDNEVREVEEIPDQDKLSKTDAGVETVKGNDNAPPTLEGIENGTGPVGGPVEEVFEDKVYIAVEKAAEFPGGQAALYKFLQSKFRYTSAASRAGIEGTLIISFVIGQDGSVRDVEVMKGLGYGLDEEAIRVVKSMPKWSAPEQNGRKVSQKFTIPYRIAVR